MTLGTPIVPRPDQLLAKEIHESVRAARALPLGTSTWTWGPEGLRTTPWVPLETPTI